MILSGHFGAHECIPKNSHDVIHKDAERNRDKGKVDPIDGWPNVVVGQEHGTHCIKNFGCGGAKRGNCRKEEW